MLAQKYQYPLYEKPLGGNKDGLSCVHVHQSCSPLFP
jgi:hypothetical protein